MKTKTVISSVPEAAIGEEPASSAIEKRGTNTNQNSRANKKCKKGKGSKNKKGRPCTETDPDPVGRPRLKIFNCRAFTDVVDDTFCSDIIDRRARTMRFVKEIQLSEDRTVATVTCCEINLAYET